MTNKKSPVFQVKLGSDHQISDIDIEQNNGFMGSITVIPPAQIDWIHGKVKEWETPKLPANENTFK